MIAAKHRTIGHIDFRSAIGFHFHTDNVAGVDNRDTEVDKSIDVGRIISVEAGVVLCRCHSIGTALIAGCLRFESAMIERKCAGGDSVIVLDRRFQLSKDIF